jgi:hypothetical protein
MIRTKIRPNQGDTTFSLTKVYRVTLCRVLWPQNRSISLPNIPFIIWEPRYKKQTNANSWVKKLRARKVGINQMKKTALVKILLFNLLPSRIYTGSLYKEIFNEIPDKSNR